MIPTWLRAAQARLDPRAWLAPETFPSADGRGGTHEGNP